LEDGQLPGNILEKFESRHSSAELKTLEIPFEFAKPSALIKFLMTVCGVGEDEIILDFFSGSGSTGHAALELQCETNRSQPFICVQLPEKTLAESEEYKAGFKTIFEIGRERIRRVAAKLSEHGAMGTQKLGFRVFKLDQSNFMGWDAGAS